MLANLHLLDQQLAQSHWRFAFTCPDTQNNPSHNLLIFSNAFAGSIFEFWRQHLWMLSWFGNLIWSLFSTSKTASWTSAREGLPPNSDLDSMVHGWGWLWISMGDPWRPNDSEDLYKWKGVSLDSRRNYITREVQKNANICKRSLGASLGVEVTIAAKHLSDSSQLEILVEDTGLPSAARLALSCILLIGSTSLHHWSLCLFCSFC